MMYVGETGRCINVRLGEHLSSIKGAPSARQEINCKTCKWKSLFKRTEIKASFQCNIAGEVIEAHTMIKAGADKCVSQPSLSLC